MNQRYVRYFFPSFFLSLLILFALRGFSVPYLHGEPGEVSSYKQAMPERQTASTLVPCICIQSNYNGGIATQNVRECVATTDPDPSEMGEGTTWIGDFVEGDLANHDLLYDFYHDIGGWDPASPRPWSSWVTFNVDGNLYNIRGVPAGTSTPTLISAPSSAGDTIWTTWRTPEGIEITQKLSPRQINGPGSATILYQYQIENTSSSSHNVGVLLQFDTMINGNDATRISTAYGFEDNELDFVAPSIPNYWQAWENDDLTGIVAQGDLIGPEAVMPDRVCMGYWETYYDVAWSYTAFGLPYVDSAVLLWWNPVPVPAGGSHEVATYYGLGGDLVAEGDLQLNLNPVTLNCARCGEISPDPFELVLLVTNTYYDFFHPFGVIAENVQTVLTIDHPECLTLVSGALTQYTTPQNLNGGTLLDPVGETGTSAWRFSPNPACEGDSVCFHIEVTTTTSSIPGNSIDYCIYIPICIGNPPDVYAGMDTIICLGESLRIGGAPTAYGGSPPYSYSWTPATYISSTTVANPMVWPPSPANYICTVTDDSGCVGVDTVYIQISDPSADAGFDTTLCNGESVEIGGRPTGWGGFEPYSYSWVPIDMLSDHTDPNPLATPTTTTTFTVSVTDRIGCIAYDTVLVTVANSPLVSILIPQPCEGITSCEFQEIVFLITDSTSEVDTSALILNIEGALFTIRDPELSWSDPGTLIFIPSRPWDHGDTVNFYLHDVRNIALCYADTVFCSFIVDILPPVPFSEEPHADTVIFTPTPTITIQITDTPAGIDTASFNFITVYVNGIPVTGYTITWDGLNLGFEGLTFMDGDSVMICLDRLYDDPYYDYCEPNDTAYCWWFIVALSGPEAYIIHPMPDSITACDPETIIIHLAGTMAEVDPATIELYIDCILYTIASPYLEYYPADSLLIFAPPEGFWTPYDGDSVHVELLRADDIHGAPLEDPLIWHFWVDYSPPVFWNILPPPDTTITTPAPMISINLYDSLSGLDQDSLLMVINGTMEFRIGDPGVSWDGTAFTLSTTGV
ncbi:hypothetical protein JW877_08095, partial [bacterium]|nr:hypothetical protein [bacterium]